MFAQIRITEERIHSQVYGKIKELSMLEEFRECPRDVELDVAGISLKEFSHVSGGRRRMRCGAHWHGNIVGFVSVDVVIAYDVREMLLTLSGTCEGVTELQLDFGNWDSTAWEWRIGDTLVAYCSMLSTPFPSADPLKAP